MSIAPHSVRSSIHLWSYIALVFAAFLISIHGQSASHVILISGDRTPAGFIHAKEVIDITPNERRAITDISDDARQFGRDDSTLAILESKSELNESYLLVVDTATATIITNVSLGQIRPVPRINPLVQSLVVESDNSTVYFPTFDMQNPDSFNCAEVNWKTGWVLNYTNAGHTVGLPKEFVPIPGGFAMNYWDKQSPAMIGALFNSAAQKLRLIVLPDLYGINHGPNQFFFLPTVGLIEYCPDFFFRLTNMVPAANWVSSNRIPVPTMHAKLIEHGQPAIIQLTEAALSTNGVVPLAIPVAEIGSKIFARYLDGKPCLIWGEKPDLESQGSAISKIVIFDWNSKRDLLRKDLGTSTTTFQPDADGSGVYFLDSKDGKVKCLDVRSQTITSFSDEPVPNPAASIIVVAR